MNKNFEIPTYGDVVSWGDDSEDFAHSLGGNNNGRENSENLPLSLRQNMEYEKNSKLLEVVDKNSYPINKVETSEKVISFSFDYIFFVYIIFYYQMIFFYFLLLFLLYMKEAQNLSFLVQLF